MSIVHHVDKVLVDNGYHIEVYDSKENIQVYFGDPREGLLPGMLTSIYSMPLPLDGVITFTDEIKLLLPSKYTSLLISFQNKGKSPYKLSYLLDISASDNLFTNLMAVTISISIIIIVLIYMYAYLSISK